MSKIDLQQLYLDPPTWFANINMAQKELLKQSIFLLNDANQHKFIYYDYSYIIMPAAKGYEGYVKDLLLKLGFITNKQQLSSRFRVGKALNPSLVNHKYYGKDAIYADLVNSCHGRAMAEELWQTWKICRNQTFHFFHDQEHRIDLLTAEERVLQIITTIKNSTISCQDNIY